MALSYSELYRLCPCFGLPGSPQNAPGVCCTVLLSRSFSFFLPAMFFGNYIYSYSANALATASYPTVEMLYTKQLSRVSRLSQIQYTYWQLHTKHNYYRSSYKCRAVIHAPPPRLVELERNFDIFELLDPRHMAGFSRCSSLDSLTGI